MIRAGPLAGASLEAGVLIGSGLWDGRKHYLDKMTLGDLVRAYAAYPAIQAYAVLAVVATGLMVALGTDRPMAVAAAMAATSSGLRENIAPALREISTPTLLVRVVMYLKD